MSQLFSTLFFGDNEEFESFLGDEVEGFLGRVSSSLESSALRLPLMVLMGDEDDALAMEESATDRKKQPEGAELFEKLEKIRIEKSGLVCSICLDELLMGSEARRLPCSHIYHGKCILEWLKKSKTKTCPLCRGSIAG